MRIKRAAPKYDFIDIPQRLRDKIDPQDTCWLWTGKVAANGYGRAWYDGREQPAHRVVWITLVGPLPEDTPELDHHCRVKRCVNPSCLEPVSRQENHRRWAMSITACPRGHDYDDSNTYLGKNPDGSIKQKACKECRRERHRVWSRNRSAA